MKNYVITTDIRSDLTKEYGNKHHVGFLPFYYEVDQVIYGRKKELPLTEYYRQLQSRTKLQILPSSVEQIKKFFLPYLEEGVDILHIATTKILNSEYSVLQNAVEELQLEYPHMKIVVVDSKTTSIGLGELVKKAVSMKRNGQRLEDIVKWLEQQNTNFLGGFIVEDISYAVEQNMISKQQGFLFKILRRKPIIILNEKGIVEQFCSRRNQFRCLLNKIQKQKIRQDGTFFILHGDALEQARVLSTSLTKQYPQSSVQIQMMNPALGYLFGKGAIGLCFIEQGQ